MTIHLCRDFLTLPSSPSPGTNMYLVSMFLQHVMSAKVNSFHNFDLDSSTYTKGGIGRKDGSINLDVDPAIVWLPSGAYSADSSDVNRVLALRSEVSSTFNSGLFRITAVSTDPVLGTGLKIDYRSSEDPQFESGSLAWRVYASEAEVSALWLIGSNGSTGYNSNGSAANSRIVLSTPAGYCVRLCMESVPDRSGTVPCGFTIAPGDAAGVNINADFDNSKGHLHGPAWFNTTSSLYKGTAVGLSPMINGLSDATGQWRFTAIGDTFNCSVALFTQNVSFVTGGTGWGVFGIPEDELLPIPDSEHVIDRLFVIGYGNALPNLTWHSGFFSDGHAQGVTWSRYGSPMPLIMSSYADIRNQTPHVRNLSTATDTPFMGLTELLDVDLLGGVMSSSFSVRASAIVPFAARRIGRLPLVRQGRSNYAQWSTTPDKQWLHTQDGIFVTWNGPFLTGSPVGSSNALLVLQTSLTGGSGIQFFEPDPPMSDPIVETVTVASDKDATRFRKTYSYHRQQVVEVNVVKGGSNPSKP